MSMCRVVTCAVGRGCLLWPVHSLGKTLLAFGLLHFLVQGQTCLLLQVSLDPAFAFKSPMMKRTSFFGKLEVVEQGMARVNINILGISELKWTGMGEFNSDDHCIYYCGQEFIRRHRVPLIVNKGPKEQYLCALSKMTEWSHFVSRTNHWTSQQSKSIP